MTACCSSWARLAIRGGRCGCREFLTPPVADGGALGAEGCCAGWARCVRATCGQSASDFSEKQAWADGVGVAVAASSVSGCKAEKADGPVADAGRVPSAPRAPLGAGWRSRTRAAVHFCQCCFSRCRDRTRARRWCWVALASPRHRGRIEHGVGKGQRRGRPCTAVSIARACGCGRSNGWDGGVCLRAAGRRGRRPCSRRQLDGVQRKGSNISWAQTTARATVDAAGKEEGAVVFFGELLTDLLGDEMVAAIFLVCGINAVQSLDVLPRSRECSRPLFGVERGRIGFLFREIFVPRLGVDEVVEASGRSLHRIPSAGGTR